MRASVLVTTVLLAAGLGACDTGEEEDLNGLSDPESTATEAQPNFTSEDEVYAGRPDVPERADVDPGLALERFFQVLQEGEVDSVVALVAEEPLEVDRERLRRHIEAWRENIPDDETFEVRDVYEAGNFAIARAVFVGPDGNGGGAVRPVVLFQEEGDWRVVWDLIGKQQDQVAEDLANRLDPLYEWYEDQELRAGIEGDDLPGRGVEVPPAGNAAGQPSG